MTSAMRARLFEPFFTPRPTAQGLGLGLCTVYGIVQQCGGEVWADSDAGRGSTLKLFLPCSEGPAEAPATRAARAPAASAAETILVVDDDPALREVMVEHLDGLGYRVLSAASAREALDAAAAHQGALDLLLTDLVMPGMGGRELAERLARDRPRARVLCISGYTDDSVVLERIKAQAVPFLQKPFTLEALESAVRAALARG
jgi:two-component system, cell cycle sensor histidine kinase and response regulator CckA